jgi:threonyl-tRNA synthetase
VVGDREQEAGTLAVRSHEEGDLGALPRSELIERIRAEAG